jgi:hypothetical protein
LAILKGIMFFGVGWAMAIWVSANAICALARPSQWLRAKWTFTKGFAGDEASWAIRCFGVFMLVGGIVITTAISVVSFVLVRQWYEGRP